MVQDPQKSAPVGETLVQGEDPPDAGSHATKIQSTVPAPESSEPPPSSLTELHDLETLPLVTRDRYAMDRIFAQGGIGRILKATDLYLDRIVAIKEMRREGSRYARLRFAREIRITAKLQHPNIIAVHEAGRWPHGEPFFTMKLVEGGSLDEAIDRAETPRRRRDLLPHVIDAADAMAYAHSQDIVHRDLKPTNILVGPFGETVVIDWGLAKDKSMPEERELPPPSATPSNPVSYQTTDGAIMGTPPYMPPEQAAGKVVDERADVYALGAILYHVLSGHVPYFEAPPRAVLRRVLNGPPTSLELLEPHTPPDLLAIVEKAMSRDPMHRYTDAADMAEELHRYADGRLVQAYTYSPVELLQRFVRRYRAAVTVAAVGAILLFSLGAWSVRRIAQQRDRAEIARVAAEAAAEREAAAHAEAERRLAEAILSGAEAALTQDPTLSIGLMKGLASPLPGAITVAADAVERGVARQVLTGPLDRIESLTMADQGVVIATTTDGSVWRWGADGKGTASAFHQGRVPSLAQSERLGLLTLGYDGKLVRWSGGEGKALFSEETSWRAMATAGDRVAIAGLGGLRVLRATEGAPEVVLDDTTPVDRPGFVVLSGDGVQVVTGNHPDNTARWYRGDGKPVVLEHPAPVTAAAFDEDGKLHTACEDGQIRTFVDGPKPTRTLGAHRGPVTAIVAAKGNTLVSAGYDGFVKAWLPDDPRPLPLFEHDERVMTLVLSADRNRVASGSWDRSVGVFDLKTRRQWRLRGHRDAVEALAFSADGQSLASGSWDREVRLWSLGVGEPRQRRRAHRFGVKTVAFSPDGKLIASGGHDDRVRLWGRDGVPKQTWSGHTDHIFRVLFSPDGQWIASSSDDRTVRLWPVGGGDPIIHRGHVADVEELAFSPDGKYVASAGEDHKVGLWPVGPGEGRMLEDHAGAVTGVLFHGQKLVSSSLDGTVRTWNPQTGQADAPWSLGRPVTTIGHATKADVIGVATAEAVVVRAEGGEPVSLTSIKAADHLAFSSDGRQLAVGTSRGVVWLCTWRDQTCQRFTGHGSKIHALAFAPDETTLLSASGDGTVRVWNCATGESHPVRMHTASVFDLAVSPDGKLVVSASGDMTLAWWPPTPPPPDLAPFLARATDFVPSKDP